jgi:acyl-CoA thioester hydrolase
VLPRDPVVGHVYTGRVRSSHHELDTFGRVYPAAYLRHLAAVAVDASSAAGFDGRWYAANGVHWLVRRTTFTVHAPATVGTELVIRTWVEDFRRVRSQRRYEVRTPDEKVVLDAVTDWVLVESASGKLRRIPDEMERGFGIAPGGAATRAVWTAPEPRAARRSSYAVRYTDLDSLMHVNNAAYLDVLFQAALDALAESGWGLDRLVGAGAVPLWVAGDVEYLDAARFGDRLAVTTWFTPGADTLGVHQRLARESDDRRLVQCTSTWSWRDPMTRATVPTPAELGDAVVAESGRARGVA